MALALLAVYLIWGSTYLGIRYAIETLPPFTMAGARYLLAGLVLYGWARLHGAARPSPQAWRPALVIGALLLLGGNGGVVWAEQRVASGLAALLIASEPMWIVLLGALRPGGSRPSGRVVAGLLIGVLGVGLLAGPGAASGWSVDPTGAAVLLLASLSWAIGSLYSIRARSADSPLIGSALQMILGGLLLAVAGLVSGEWWRLDLAAISWRSAVAFFYLVVFGSLVAFTAYSWLLRVASPTLVSTYAFVNPVVAVLLGWALASEPISARVVVAALLILTAVAAITLDRGGAGRSG